MIDRDFEEASAWQELVLTDDGAAVSLDAVDAWLEGAGPDPFPHREMMPVEETWLEALGAHASPDQRLGLSGGVT